MRAAAMTRVGRMIRIASDLMAWARLESGRSRTCSRWIARPGRCCLPGLAEFALRSVGILELLLLDEDPVALAACSGQVDLVERHVRVRVVPVFVEAELAECGVEDIRSRGRVGADALAEIGRAALAGSDRIPE